ncbi:hypothetical protein LCGC14_2634220, partial [marine sediment metagenome]
MDRGQPLGPPVVFDVLGGGAAIVNRPAAEGFEQPAVVRPNELAVEVLAEDDAIVVRHPHAAVSAGNLDPQHVGVVFDVLACHFFLNAYPIDQRVGDLLHQVVDCVGVVVHPVDHFVVAHDLQGGGQRPLAVGHTDRQIGPLAHGADGVQYPGHQPVLPRVGFAQVVELFDVGDLRHGDGRVHAVLEHDLDAEPRGQHAGAVPGHQERDVDVVVVAHVALDLLRLKVDHAGRVV